MPAKTLTTYEVNVDAAGSVVYWRVELKPGEGLVNAVDPAYGAKADPDEDLPISSVLGPDITLALYAGHEYSAREADG